MTAHLLRKAAMHHVTPLSNTIRCHLASPLVLQPERTQAIRTFMRDNLGLHKPLIESAGGLPCDRWEFCMDSIDRNVEDDQPNTPYAERRCSWRYAVAVSLRGPLVTCWTSTVVPGGSGPEKDYTLYPDKPPRPSAVEWTQRLAARFALTYVDALELLAIAVEGEDLPADIWDYVDYQDPNAFNTLFCEV